MVFCSGKTQLVCIVCHPKRQFPSPHRIQAYFSAFFLGQCYVMPFHPVILFPDQCDWNHLLLPFMMLWRNSLPTSAILWGHILFTEVCATPVASKEASGHKLFTISWTTHSPVQISAAISTILASLSVFISLKCLTHHLDTASTDAGISVCMLKLCINNYVKISSFTRNVITACCQTTCPRQPNSCTELQSCDGGKWCDFYSCVRHHTQVVIIYWAL